MRFDDPCYRLPELLAGDSSTLADAAESRPITPATVRAAIDAGIRLGWCTALAGSSFDLKWMRLRFEVTDDAAAMPADNCDEVIGHE